MRTTSSPTTVFASFSSSLPASFQQQTVEIGGWIFLAFLFAAASFVPPLSLFSQVACPLACCCTCIVYLTSDAGPLGLVAVVDALIPSPCPCLPVPFSPVFHNLTDSPFRFHNKVNASRLTLD
ncbi:hypothetical protein BCR44DRAFT_377044 [Catenaria anguillulae PL171]|uniref:Uncharacterized protein n=1 Tax=Catenaria anguillulae PL171 TaxID=765915 RepID=A0A1Y2I239_9FUNG|nr:hypothetical protein BCR44DRAFT_377044 [Catenaria anguillulae PL171]